MNAKTKLKDVKASDAPAPGVSKKMLVLAAIGSLLVVALGGGVAWFLTKGDDAKGATEHTAPAGPAIFVPLDSFVVNLQPEEGDAYLQVTVTLQLAGAEQEEAIKQNMPKVRSRILMLLSGKRKSEIATIEGKQQLSREIIASLKQPFEAKGTPNQISEVLFTSFVIQ
ncbi:MAG TPA: flagellar basal body-associated protein FliL [Telluria sp.]|nr:flagellar basal body-associated protein FliL [Telluria sp.]